MYNLLKSLLFLLSPEVAHEFALKSLRIVLRMPVIGAWFRQSFQPVNAKPVVVAGITFPNSVGLAAGFDKNAKWLHLLKDLGFGHVEIGTVTPLPQPGNPAPRLFRLPQDSALINRMGFNNDGIEAVVARLKTVLPDWWLAETSAKTRSPPNEQAAQDYTIAFEAIYDHVDYIVVNISSPNTPGLRDLQEDEFICDLFTKLQAIRAERRIWKPIFLKIAPDFQQSQVHALIQTIRKAKVDGVIATNTTIDRSNLNTAKSKVEQMGAGD